MLDLRNNPGGYSSASVNVAGLFLNGGPVVYRGRLPNSDMHLTPSPEISPMGHRSSC